jgi:TonB-linked SusC/RagA family outer membrane protein
MNKTKRQLFGKFTLFLLLAACSSLAFGQTVLKGKVTDTKGNGIANASVTLSRSKVGVTSMGDGSYELTIAKAGNYTVTFSAVGYNRQEKNITAVAGANTIELNAELEEKAAKLDEVVVTGTSAGTTKKQLGNYIATVKSDELSKGAAGNALAALQGKTAGAQISQNSGDPAGGMSVRLRGVSTINSSSEPLYIVDGVIVNNATNRVTNTQGNYDGTRVVGTIGQNRMVDINPADIDRVEVLNGAAAAAIYGSRANAGVIQIFTKRGKAGKPTVTFSTNFITSKLRKRLDVNRSPVKFGGGTEVFTQDVIATGPKPVSALPLYRPDTLSTITTPVARYDYQDDIFQTAIGTDNNLTVTGGNENTKYMFSSSYYKNEGIIKNTDFQRFSFRSNIDQTFNKWVSGSFGINYINSAANEKPDGNSFYSPMNSVNIIGNFHDIRTRDGLGNLKSVGERGRVNPISVIDDIEQKNTTNRILLSAGVKLRPIKDLLIDYTLGIDNYSQNGTTYIEPYQYNSADGNFGGGGGLIANRNGYASAATNNFFGVNHDVNATYSYTIAKKLSATTQVGFSQQYEKNSYIMAQGRGLAPLVRSVLGSSTILPSVDDRSEISINGVFLQQNFKYNNQFFVTGAIRRDASSVFGENQRNQVYAKVSGSYVISGGEFWQKSSVSKWWDLAKVRVAYGESGNLTGIGAYDRINTYSSNSFLSKNALTSRGIQANADVKPERQKEIEFGVDLAFLKNRVGVTVNVYNKKVNDLLLDRQVAPSTGFSSLLDNVGNLENKGFEVVVNATPVEIKNFSWNITGILNRNRNRVINTGQPLITFATNGGAPIALIEGQPAGVFYGTFFATTPGGSFSKQANGLPNHNGLVLNPNGIPRQAYGTQTSPTTYNQLDFLPGGAQGLGIPQGAPLRKIIGDPNPDYTATLINEFKYKKFGFRIQLDAVKGGDIFNADFRTRQGVGNGKLAELEQTGQLPRGYISPYGVGNVPAGVTVPSNIVLNQGIYAIEEWRIDDGSFTKLRELQISYSAGKIKWFNDVTISITGRNLYSWDKYIGYDPEVNAGGQSTLIRGVDFGAVPIPRTFSFGLQAKF